MRISGGAARGVPLQVPKGDAVRPATDGLRQAVFSSLAARVPGARFADLFAGSGAYGLEALSRGAAGGVWVEKNAKAAACLRANLAAVRKSLGREPLAADGPNGLAVREADALTAPLDLDGQLPNLVFIDPPYEIIADIAPKLLTHVATALAAVAGPVIVFELPGGQTLPLPPGWREAKRLGGKSARQPAAAILTRG
jgi:16S rRNA (guanine966-N2)-methyltransferase